MENIGVLKTGYEDMSLKTHKYNMALDDGINNACDCPSDPSGYHTFPQLHPIKVKNV